MSLIEKLKKLFNIKSANCDMPADEGGSIDIDELKVKYASLRRNCIEVKSNGDAENDELTRFGGKPLAPKNFKWPYFETDSFDEPESEIKPRPLAFLCQFDCSQFSQYDKDNLLPHSGILSFFYSVESNRWGFDPADKGCSQVYWFENSKELDLVDYPDDLAEDYRFPTLAFKLAQGDSYPDWENIASDDYDFDEYCDFTDALRCEDEPITKLLGWADVIQSEMESECALVTKGFYLGGTDEIPQAARDEAEHSAQNDWLLLFQMDTIERGDFELMFGDGGRIYFWITKDDLAARRFDRAWLILQCG